MRWLPLPRSGAPALRSNNRPDNRNRRSIEQERMIGLSKVWDKQETPAYPGDTITPSQAGEKATRAENGEKRPELLAMLGSPQFTKARRRVIRQLLQAMIYEGIAAPQISQAEGGELHFTIEGQDEAGRPVRYVSQGRRRLSFGHIRLTGAPTVRLAEGEEREADDPALLLQELAPFLTEEPRHLASFVKEIEQTLLKDAMSEYERYQRVLHEHAASPQALQATAAGGAFAADGQPAGEDGEGEAADGHPYHPCYKSRIGFSLADNRAFGPEFKPRLRLVWVAVRRRCLHIASSQDVTAEELVREELGEAEYERFAARLSDAGKRPDDYLFLPVHPWQWREKVVGTYFRELRSGDIVWLGEGSDEYTPQQSIRTLTNRTAPLKHNVKTPLSILNTSAVRILGTHHTANAPVLSDWLRAVVDSDPYLRSELRPVILREVVGIAFRYEQLPDPVRKDAYGSLSVIWRESLHRFLEPGEGTVPFSALAQTGADGRPLIDAWVARLGLERWLEQLLKVSVRPLLHLLFAHGIAMESHGQNMALLHRDGMPSRIALRDIPGGVRYFTRSPDDPLRPVQLQASSVWHPNSYSTSPMETDRAGKVRNFLMDSFFQISFTAMADLLETYYGLEERDFWQRMAAEIRSYQQQFPQHAEAFERFDVFVETIDVGQLTKRRLCGEHVVRDHAVQNPLSLF